MADIEPFEIRLAALRFLYDRRALPHMLSAVHAGLRREGLDVSEADVTDALAYLVDEKCAARQPGVFGGGAKSAAWRITSHGINTREDNP